MNVFWRLDFRKITSCGWLEASSYGKIWQNHFIAVNLESFNLIFLVFFQTELDHTICGLTNETFFPDIATETLHRFMAVQLQPPMAWCFLS